MRPFGASFGVIYGHHPQCTPKVERQDLYRCAKIKKIRLKHDNLLNSNYRHFGIFSCFPALSAIIDW